MEGDVVLCSGDCDISPSIPKKFSCIVADPPWFIKAGRSLGGYVVKDGVQVWDMSHTKSRDLSYPTMSVEQICSLPVGDLADTDCHLYLWTINRYVEDSYRVARSWGFTPSTMLVWAKNPFGSGLGGAFGISTEFVLFCRKGSLAPLRKVSGTWWNWKRPYSKAGKPVHSSKPEQFQDMVETVSPGPYLELFARRRRSGWYCWGNQVHSDICI